MAGMLVDNSSKFFCLYKKKGSPWKETYRKRCTARLKDARSDVFNRSRNLLASPSASPSSSTSCSVVSQVMKDEWKALFGSESGFPQITEEDYDIIEDIEQTLLAQEKELIAQEYERVCEFEMKGMEWLTTESVICPICQIRDLCERSTGISCSCGFKLRNESNLKEFSFRLEDILKLHNPSCPSQLQFHSPWENLIIFCNECKFYKEIM